MSRIGWGGEADLTADDILGHAAKKKRTVGDQCAETLTELLADGPKDAAEVKVALRQLSYSEDAVKKARQLLKVHVQRVGFGAEGKWMLRLPDPVKPDSPDDSDSKGVPIGDEPPLSAERDTPFESFLEKTIGGETGEQPLCEKDEENVIGDGKQPLCEKHGEKEQSSKGDHFDCAKPIRSILESESGLCPVPDDDSEVF